MKAFISVLTLCMRHRYITVGVTVLLFLLSLFGQTLLQRQFFPASDRPELLVTLILPANASILATQTEVDRIEALIKDDAGRAESWSSYVGGGAIRFYLPLDVQGDNDFVAQMVIVRPRTSRRGPGSRRSSSRPSPAWTLHRPRGAARARLLVRLAGPVPRHRQHHRPGAGLAQQVADGAAILGAARPSISTGARRPRRCGSRSTRTAPASSA